MTIVVSVQCSEGIVLAADSAVSLDSEHGGYVWPHAKKLSHIGDHHIGTLSFGLGAIDQRNIQSLMYEFEVHEHFGCKKEDKITVSGISNALYEFLKEKHNKVYGSDKNPRYGMGMIVAGYSEGSFIPEQYRFKIPFDSGPIKINFPENVGIIFEGLPDAIHRLINGIDPKLAIALSRISLNEQQRNTLTEELDKMTGGYVREAIDDFKNSITDDSDELKKWLGWQRLMTYNIIEPGMPLQDGIDLAIWLIESTIGRYRFAYPIPLAGGPIDIAVITHATYTWIQRKSWHGYEKKPIRFQ